MTETPTLKTQHLTLRPLQPADAATLHRIYQTQSVLWYFPSPDPPPLEKAQRFTAGQQEHQETFGSGNWGILPADSEPDEIVGGAGLQFLLELNETEVGYLLDKPFWGKGYATEAAHASLEFGFDHFAFSRLIALVHPENIASWRMLEKCGLTSISRPYISGGIDLMRHQIERAETRRKSLNRILVNIFY